MPSDVTPASPSFDPRLTLTLTTNDTLLVVGCEFSQSAHGYDTASLDRLWTYKTGFAVGAICILGAAQVLVAAGREVKATLVLDLKTGAHVASLQEGNGWISGLGVIGGLSIPHSSHSHSLRPPHLRVSLHAAASPLQASQGSAFAAGDVGLYCKVSIVDVIAV
jgi:hypothetical protein